MSAEREAYNEYVRALGTATRSMSASIKKSIKFKDAIDTGRMKNVSIVKIVTDKTDKMPKYMEIDTTFYYKFVDQGTRYISPREITKHMRGTKEWKREMKRVMTAWSKWQTLKAIQL